MAVPTDLSDLLPFHVAILPGSDRKKAERPYRYRLLFRTSDPKANGCVLICEVQGGRLPYQIAVERKHDGPLQLHCTCADAVFRAENEGRFCKHIVGFLEFGQTKETNEEATCQRPHVA